MKRFIPLIIFALLAMLLAVGLTLNPKIIPSALINKPAPGFQLPDLTNPTATVSNENFAGKVVLLNVWASWCPACKQEHPVLIAISKTKIVDIYGLNWKDERNIATQVLNTTGNPYTATAYDEDGRVGIDYGVYGAPETFVIDKKGIIRHKIIAPITPQIWEKELLPMITKLKAE